MKQIIPFKKELLFKTKVNEITSISLEYSITSCSNNTLSGTFLITGDYKMTEGSINKEKFNFDIPFEISLDDKYDEKTVKMDIDNFYYELVNSEILKVNIDAYVLGEEKVNKETVTDKEDRVEINNDVITKNDDNVIDNNNEEEISIINSQNNFLGSFDADDTYITYYVYMVKEGDTIESIQDKFKVTKEELEKYNDLSLFKEKTKLVIPSYNE